MRRHANRNRRSSSEARLEMPLALRSCTIHTPPALRSNALNQHEGVDISELLLRLTKQEI